MSKKVVIGLSGGVDSSVAALLLQQQGYEVIGLFMRNWNDASVTLEDDCPWVEDSADALLVAEKLGIPFQVIDMSDIYKERIVDYMFAEYEAGRTPNPDVLCNREIKFDVFLETALNLGADFVATGHYCRKAEWEKDGEKVYRLLAGKDQNKDQSYFLCQLNQFQLSKALFPIGELQKSEVRALARAHDLATADKKDSQGLCFIGKVSLPDFLQQQLQPKKGDIIEISSDFEAYQKSQSLDEINFLSLEKFSKNFVYQPTDGQKVGEHQGAHYFTNGQRRGLGVGGKVEPVFVLATDVEKNIIYVGEGKNHPGLWRKVLRVAAEDVHWIREDLALQNNGDYMEVSARIRYRQPLQKAKLYLFQQQLFLVFEESQSSITAGQFAAWYMDDELLGSGVIAE
ncbi:tRNA-specific 2-thiouridylase mnmA [Candidatus Ornithobacterium hominis]|uniref:tRNA-specific 2-thiouridylase MnmA n=1 Tax=Candidatus Ornithobacterium hominis TaxID=2497989 RepID=A0A383U1S3_9FLAO|nr:tRNA 2-thiouridine(34) synthase MnmA [Candidatus Ornithobacterium hominis]MCT7904963.1 tRNA 2-thiouridine(34) synthase MnmA [Candidatus Ornithobacterium hominis]SZD73470.1 tRNA-specific 2-thiouridylase mnmA [Candidatus Ornithobacterium hominis]